MTLEVIYIVRHGFRINFHVDPATGVYTSGAGLHTPTGLPADVPLTAHGVEQARELAAHLDGLAPPIERVYSSPYYRCLQTVEPFVRQRVAARAAAAAAATGSGSGSDGDGDGERLRIRPETGLAEWYGSAPFEQPRPAPVDRLRPLFPGLLAGDHAPLLDVPRRGETMAQLHARVALALGRIVDQGDAEGVRAVLLCSHAAAIIAMGRVLTGRMPPDPDEDDFRAFTCGLSMYRRRRVGGTSASSAAALVATGNETRGSSAASAKEEEAESWRDGRGVRGGWDVLLNSDCSFLTGGEERGWSFHGDESFGGDPLDSDSATAGGPALRDTSATEQDKTQKGESHL